MHCLVDIVLFVVDDDPKSSYVCTYRYKLNNYIILIVKGRHFTERNVVDMFQCCKRFRNRGRQSASKVPLSLFLPKARAKESVDV